ncbi:hypothetical protein OH720_15620 [Pseudomonas sp. WJP1]|uniref:T4 family baseplate hub assembly chaperone n=1 Tax=Pseudomonas sp. WJP1 TaxID=2986947 RepID=UPI002349AAD7|nr:hypothetical protein [Pseudomonas sp. WJP1]WCM54373.1 hypothetical protein OH720_15620 [Pseudomonas sp. WJP1]
MSTLTTSDWLTILDHSLTLPTALRPCALLAPLLTDGQAGAERLPLGRRDAHLLDLYGALLGPQLTALACCGHCGEQVELNLSTSQLRLDDSPTDEACGQFEWEDYLVHFRLPDSLDLQALVPETSIDQARKVLAGRCLLEAQQGGQTVEFSTLPQALLQALSEAMGRADPQALTELQMCCPACDQRWSEVFDIASYLLEGLDHWARQTLDHVHLLATAYGWSEGQILALSPQRRARYLERVLS